MYTAAYWIDPTGKILDICGNSHISKIIANPNKFGLTRNYIDSLYKKHNENIGLEGKAREEIIRSVATEGFIRIRMYPSYWSVTVNHLDDRAKKALGVWSIAVIKNKRLGGPHTDVNILELKDGQLNSVYNINKLTSIQYQQADNFHPRFVSIEEFGYEISI